MSASLVYLSIVEAVRLKRPAAEIASELTEQSLEDPGKMIRILVADLVDLIRENQTIREKSNSHS